MRLGLRISLVSWALLSGPAMADPAEVATPFVTVDAPAAPEAGAETVAASLDPAAAAVTFREAGERYLAGEFAEAARRYQALTAAGWSGAALHYDLGNAWFRAGRTGKAAASWERALRLDPGDAEARANLELVRRSYSGRMPWARGDPLPERAAARLSDTAAALGFGLAWAAMWAALTLRIAARGGRRALISTMAAIAALASLTFGAAIAIQARSLRTPRAVVVAPASLREAASDAAPSVLDLPEGAPVRVLAAEGGFYRVQLPGGIEGWAGREEIELL